MGGNRQVALDLQQDIVTSDDISWVEKRLEGKSKEEIEEICSLEIDGRTVFQTIASHDRAKVLEKILSYGVNINRVDRYAVHVAISQKAVNVMKILLSHKANIDCATEDGKTPLHIASELGYVKIVKELLENGAKAMLNQLEKTGCTPLTLACMTDHRETATCLIIYGAAINFEGGFPPLHAAALMGYTDLVKMLLDRGAYVNLRDIKGETALHYSSYKAHRQIVQLLLNRGARVSYFDARGKTPVDLTTDDEIKLLLENKLQTENSSRGRRDSGPRNIVRLDMISIKPDTSQPNIDEPIEEEKEEDVGKHENIDDADDTTDKSEEKDDEVQDEGACCQDEAQSNRLNANVNNSTGESELHKKVSTQSTFSTDSETGERKSKARSQSNRCVEQTLESKENGISSKDDVEDKLSISTQDINEKKRNESIHNNEQDVAENIKQRKKKKGGCVTM